MRVSEIIGNEFSGLRAWGSVLRDARKRLVKPGGRPSHRSTTAVALIWISAKSAALPGFSPVRLRGGEVFVSVRLFICGGPEGCA